jgi:hypothetical protein
LSSTKTKKPRKNKKYAAKLIEHEGQLILLLPEEIIKNYKLTDKSNYDLVYKKGAIFVNLYKEKAANEKTND